MCSLYEEFVIFILVIQTALLSLFLFILFKGIQKIIYDNNSLRKVLNDKIDDLAITINKFSTLILKNDIFYENSSLQKSLSEINLLLEKANSTLGKFDNGKLQNSDDNSNNNAFKSSSSSPPSSLPLSSTGFISTQVDSAIDKSKALKDELENAENAENNTNEKNSQNNENNSLNELKTLEKEILIALKRLEKTNSNIDVEKEKNEN